jgi:hypothetical protein
MPPRSEDYYLAAVVLERARKGEEKLYSSAKVRSNAWTYESIQARKTRMVASPSMSSRQFATAAIQSMIVEAAPIRDAKNSTEN